MRKGTLKLPLVEFNDEGFYRLPKEPDIGLRHSTLVGKKESPQQSRHLLFGQKNALVGVRFL